MRENVVVIGAVALGPKAACRYKRLNPEGRVVLLDRGSRISYGGCGIPYYVSGDVSDADELQSTSFHMLRDVAFFRDTKDIEARTRTEALAIDRAAKTVLVRNLDSGLEESLPYDKLVLATGSSPRSLPIPGADLGGVFAVADLDAAVKIRAGLTAGQVGSAVVVGAGFIGLEMAVALADMWGIETTVVEYAPSVLPTVLGPTLAAMAQRHMEDKGVGFRLGAQVTALEGEDGAVKRVQVKTAAGVETLDADLVIMSVGVTPNAELARAAGLSVSPRGGILVDALLRTSDPDIFAGGDCAEIKNIVTGQNFFLPLGSLANRQGRVIGDNLCGLGTRFEGAAGAWCVKLFEQSAAGVGLTLEAARRAGFDAVSVHVSQLDRAHFYPDKDFMFLELVAERGTRRVLGMQGVSAMGDALVGRVGAVSALMSYTPTTTDLSLLELPYSPPFSSAMDIVNMLGNVAENILTGRNQSIDPFEFAALFAEAAPGVFFLDCRELGNAAPFLAKYPGLWHHIPQGQLAGRLDELPRDRKIVLLCNTGTRSYEAFVTLAHAGFTDVVNVAGGMVSLHHTGTDPKV